MRTEKELLDFIHQYSDVEIEEITDNKPVSLNDDGSVRSYITNEKWDFNQYNDGTVTNSLYTLNWNHDKHDPQLLNDLKRRFDYLFNPQDDSLDVDRKTVQAHVIVDSANKVGLLLQHFKDSNIHNLGALSHPIIWGMVEDVIRDKKYSLETVKGVLTAFKRLEEANNYLPENEWLILEFERNKLAKDLSDTSGGNTPTIIPEIYSNVLGKLIHVIEDAKENIDELSLPTKELALKRGITGAEAYYHKKYITGCCFMSQMAFTGFRISELVTIDIDSYDVIEVLGIEAPILSASTRKLEGGNARSDIWCCAPICETGIEVIHKLWESERVISQDIMELPNYSFLRKAGSEGQISKQIKSTVLNKSNMTSLMELVSDEFDITYDPAWEESYLVLNATVLPIRDPRIKREDGTFRWHFANHAWRRSFAHFVVGNGIVSMSSVKQQFKHICAGMTGIYCASSEILTLLGMKEDKTLIKEINDAKKEYTDEYLRATFSDENLASGGFAKTVLGEGEPQVLTEERYQELEASTYTASKSTGYGRCFGGERCSMIHVFEPAACVAEDCNNLSINAEEAMRWKVRHKRLSDSITTMFDSGFVNRNVLGRELCDLRAAEKVMTDHKIPFKRLELTL